MDTKGLQIGQKVWMRSGDKIKEGTVFDLTTKTIVVEIEDRTGCRYWVPFDKNGEQPEGNDPDFTIEARGADGWIEPRPLCGKERVHQFETYGKPGTYGEPWRLIEK